MSIGLVGRKCGMSRIFTEDGRSIPVTLIEATPNRVTQLKTTEVDGYNAIQVTAGSKRAALVNKPMAGHFAKAQVEAQAPNLFYLLAEQGRRHQIRRHLKHIAHPILGDATHGNSLSHRAPGSIGQRQTPGRVFPGKKMSGHMGAVRRSAMNLEVVKIDAERHLIAIKGSVPGAQGGNVIIRPAVKA